LKRTCRIEVVRYTRQTSVFGREGETTPDAADSTAAPLLEALGAVSLAPEGEDNCARPEGGAGPPVPRRSRFHRLLDWLGWA
jgi:hypothetical protein